MNPTGSFDQFADAFPTGLLPEIFTLVLEEWPQAPRPSGEPLENRITNRFVGHLTNVMRKKSLPFKFLCRPKLVSADSDSETGEVDIQIDSFSRHPDAYFVFECKRLNVSYKSEFKTEASTYVGQTGMGCFLSGQYPTTCDCGGMLGYVIDGDVPSAVAAVNQVLHHRRGDLHLGPPHQLAAAAIIADARVYQTTHSPPTRTLLIYHIFLRCD
jgi:hypothetical protein